MILTAQIVADIRVLSSLFNNTLLSDAQIVSLFNDGASELYDWMVGTFETWFLDHVDFSLAGGVGANSFPMPMDKLLKDNTLERNPTQNCPDPVPRLSTWSDRNRMWSYSGDGGGRRYYPAGSNLMIFPPNLSAGDYRLWYTPKLIPVNLISYTGAGSSVVGATGVWTLAGGSSIPMVGDYLIVSGATNAGNNGTFPITAVSGNTATTGTTAGLVNESFSGVVSISEQSAFNTAMEPWILYPKVHASIAIRTSRQIEASDLTPKLALLKQRIETATANRTEEVPQSPLRDGTNRWGQNIG